jgi:uncharacterized protein with FMN-binding domain
MWAGMILVLVQAWALGQETSERGLRTPAEVETLIKQVGASAPDWWDTVELRYPDTLDLDWPLKPVGNWNNQEMLQQIGTDYTRNGEVIKLWADMGQLDRALQLAEAKARSGMPHIAYLAAGNACRQAGKYAEAQAFYEKTVAARLPAKKNNDFSRAVQQAQENLETMRLYQMLDLAQIPEGVYQGSSTAFNGPLRVAVRVTGKHIQSVKVVQHREKQFYSALSQTPQQIVAAQTVQGIDAVTGATITSEAVITATAKALASATR